MVSLRLFGGASLEGEGGTLTGPAAQRHRLALLALLALPSARALTRDKLMALLWPERDTEHARNLLNQSVYVLRKALGEDAIRSSGDELRLNTDLVPCDVVAFQEALEDDQHETAAKLYTGPFLDGFSLSGSPSFEHWVDRERARLADARAEALETLARQAEARGDTLAALAWWKDRATHDPYDSRVTLRLMRALMAAGNPAGALQRWRAHERLLREELGLEPPADLADLAEQLLGDPPAGGPTRPESRTDGLPMGAITPPLAARSAPGTAVPAQDPAASAPQFPVGPERYERTRRTVGYAIGALLVLVTVLAATQLLPGPADGPVPGAEPGVHVDRFADELLDELESRLDGAVLARRPELESSVPAAYEYWACGNEKDVLRSDSAARRGLRCCEQAVSLDPTYAAGWACVARLRLRVSTDPEAGRSPAELIAAAAEAAETAVALDDSLALGHAVLAFTHMAAFELPPAQTALMRAVELDPDNSRLRQWLVTFHLWTGRPEAALAEASRALERDSLDAAANAEYARALAANGRCDEAMAWIDRTLRALPTPLLRVPAIEAACHAADGRWEDAIAVLDASPDADSSPYTQGLLGYAHARAGHTDVARRIAQRLLVHWRRTGSGAFGVASVYAGLGDADAAFSWLDRSLEDRSLTAFAMGYQAWSMIIAPLQDDPRMERFLARLGIPAS